MLNLLITFLASFLIWFMFIGLFMLWLMHGKVKKEHVVSALVASLLAWIVSEITKGIFPTIRPFQIEGTLPLTLTVPTDPAFPSGHASAAFAMALSVRKFNKKLGLIYILFALLVGLGRVISHVHYYRDIVGGLIIGASSVYILDRLKLKKVI